MTDILGKIYVLDQGWIELVDAMGDDQSIVEAARVSYLGESKGAEQDERLIRYLLKNGHTSPFEMVEFKFRVKAPILVARQWMRHRTWSYNEVSRRYTDEDITFMVPDVLRGQANDNKQMSAGELMNSESLIPYIKRTYEACNRVYEMLIGEGVAREQARMVLPVGMYTMFYAKTDLHNLMHFIDIRNHPHAQEEIRVYAEAMLELISKVVPKTVEIWKELKK